MEFAHNWLAESPYVSTLGIVTKTLSVEDATLELPFNEDNCNPGGVLHGGVAASLVVIGAHAVSRATLGADAGPLHTVGFQINYLAAAINEAVYANVKLLRRGKELCFLNIEVKTTENKPIASASVAVRGRFGKQAADLKTAIGDSGEVDPGPMGERIGMNSFIGNRGIKAELMKGGRSRLIMPWQDNNADIEGVHEGAALALFDTTGAMAAWAETGPGMYKASTPAIQAQVLGPPPQTDLVAYSTVTQRDEELFWCDVELAGAVDQKVYIRGTVIYRIVM
ncbi:MAG: hotdog fold thioesterase [Pseudomonadales bacterium]|nr:hotdog fold thioesterase [Pseudomonadales bacterium]